MHFLLPNPMRCQHLHISSWMPFPKPVSTKDWLLVQTLASESLSSCHLQTLLVNKAYTFTFISLSRDFEIIRLRLNRKAIHNLKHHIIFCQINQPNNHQSTNQPIQRSINHNHQSTNQPIQWLIKQLPNKWDNSWGFYLLIRVCKRRYIKISIGIKINIFVNSSKTEKKDTKQQHLVHTFAQRFRSHG